MFLVGVLGWWYGRGWSDHLKRVYRGILAVANFFSIGLLLKTLFNPFKQISAGSPQGPLPVQISAFFDRLFSRVVGGTIRSITILIGLIAISLSLIWAIVAIVVWVFLPIIPILGVIMWFMGVGS